MSKPNWTPEQLAAIDLKGQILVAAAAGSGKTAVLVQRLFKRITDIDEKVDVDRFLVVTFTKAAAAEMRERIGKALEEALFSEAEGAKVEHLLQQRALLYRASITTLHSFCMELIRQYFYQIELDPAFRVADEAEADLLRQDTIEDLFEAYYAKESPEFQALVDAFGTDRDDQPVMESILRLYEFAMSQVHPKKWLEGLPLAYSWDSLEDLMQSPWGKVALQGVQDKVEEGLALLERSIQISRLPGGPTHYAPVLQDDVARLDLLRKALEVGAWSDIEKAFTEAVTFPTLPRGGKKGKVDSLVDEEEIKRLREESKKARDSAKKILEEIKNTIFSVPLPEQLPFLKKMGQLIHTLAGLTQHFSQEYQKAKRQRNIVDFSDLEHYALYLLEKDNQPSDIALRLQEYYAEVLVDEYQDINPVQERILQLVSRQDGEDANLFMVGDVKQSIYRFRMADPGLFLKKYSDYPHYIAGEETSSRNLVIDLNQNFRSRSEVIQGINYLFYQIMTKGAGEIAYDEQAALRSGAKFLTNPDLKTAEGPIEVHLFDPKNIELASLQTDQEGESEFRELEAEEEDSSVEEAETARIEARLVAARIQKMVLGCEFHIHDKELGNYRPVQYSDIVVLMRSLSSVAPIYAEEFQTAEIPVYAETNSGYFGTNEVDIMLSLLKIIDNPRLDIPLGAVLRSPLVGMNGTELGKLRSVLPKGDFYDNIVLAFWASKNNPQEEFEKGIDSSEMGSRNYSEVKQIVAKYGKDISILEVKAKHILETSPEIMAKLDLFLPRLLAWRELSRRSSLADLIWHLYEETGYLAYVGTLPSGAQRQANLRILYDRACRYEATNYRGLFRFLRFLEKFQGQGKDLGSASTVGEKENVVRFITVHSSKGLEFPVVFLAGLGKKFNTRSLSSKLLLHSQLGVGVPLIDIENQVRYPSLIQYAVKERLWQESLAEELRILYVALTRAKERLFLYGHHRKLNDTIPKWVSLAQSCSEISFPEGQLRNGKCYLDWIGPALARYPKDLFNLDYTPLNYGLPDSSSQWKVIIHESTAETTLSHDEKSLEGKTNTQNETKLQEQVVPHLDKIFQKENSLKCETIIDDGIIIIDDIHLKDELNKQKEPVIEESVNSEAQSSEIIHLDKDYLKEEIISRLRWQYPYPEAVHQSAKTSVSELKRQLSWYTDIESEALTPLLSMHNSNSSFRRPQFVQFEKKLSPAEKGTAVHTAIQHLPLTDWRDSWDAFREADREKILEDYISSLVTREILNEEQGRAVSALVLRNLLDSDIGKQLLRAEEVRREVPFTLSLRLKNKTEPVLVQGIIDAVVLSKEEQWAQVIDFKTDNLIGVPDPEGVLTDRYALQLGLYALAIERLLKISVKECLIYATSITGEYKIPKNIIQLALDSVIICS